MRKVIRIVVSLSMTAAAFFLRLWDRLKAEIDEPPRRPEDDDLALSSFRILQDTPVKTSSPGVVHHDPVEDEFDTTVMGIPSWKRISCLPEADIETGLASRSASRPDREKGNSEPSAVVTPSPLPWRGVARTDAGTQPDVGPVSHRALEEAIDDYINEELLSKKREPSSPKNRPEITPEGTGNARPIRVTRRADEAIARVNANEDSLFVRG